MIRLEFDAGAATEGRPYSTCHNATYDLAQCALPNVL